MAHGVPTIGDLLLAASLTGVAILSGFYVDAGRPDTIEPSSWWHWALMAIPAGLVAIRRSNPAVVTALAGVAQALIWISDLPDVLLSMIVILYSASSESSKWGLPVAITTSAGLTTTTAIGVRVSDDVTLYQVPLVALSCGTAIVLGHNALVQRRLATDGAAAMAEARLRAEHEQARAVADERSHITRELHDIIGHTLSVIAVRAEAADRVALRQPEAAGEAVGAIAESARAALDETRRVLAGLRDSADVDLAPPPDLSATRRLITDLAAGGVNVTLIETGCQGEPLAAIVAGGVHRIVQESLTNAIKHGGPTTEINVFLTCDSTELDLVVTNTRAATSLGQSSVAGTGVAGMAERAEVLGGRFSAAVEGERFAVRAALPTLGDSARDSRAAAP